jgi:hypothetical protein
MPRKRTPANRAAGKLISAVQKVWSYRAGTEQEAEVEAVMNRATELAQAISFGRLEQMLSGRSMRDYLGADWVACHPGVDRAVRTLESALGVV